jgi:hypothetical protein
VVFGEDKGKDVVLRAALTHAADAYILQVRSSASGFGSSMFVKQLQAIAVQ